MGTLSEIPLFNLSAVIRETGLTADVIRVWEKRYGIPAPQRTAGGHRLYSERDISILRWLVSRQREGLSIRSAVELWKEALRSGKEPLNQDRVEPISTLHYQQEDAGWLDEIRFCWLNACLDYDLRRADDTLNQAFASLPAEVVGIEVLQKGLREVGQLWFRSEITVQQEHFTTAHASRRLEAQLQAVSAPTIPWKILVAAPTGEWHSFPLLLISLLLNRRGYPVYYLGANTPMVTMEETVGKIQPQMAVLAAQRITSAASLQSSAEFFKECGIPVGYGGRVFNQIPAIRSRIPGLFLGEDVGGALDMIHQIRTAGVEVPDSAKTDEEYRGALLAYKKMRGAIDAAMDQHWIGTANYSSWLQISNLNLAEGIVAALELGDINILSADIQWVEDMIAYRGISRELIHEYLSAYGESVDRLLQANGRIISTWIEDYLSGRKTLPHE